MALISLEVMCYIYILFQFPETPEAACRVCYEMWQKESLVGP